MRFVGKPRTSCRLRSKQAGTTAEVSAPLKTFHGGSLDGLIRLVLGHEAAQLGLRSSSQEPARQSLDYLRPIGAGVAQPGRRQANPPPAGYGRVIRITLPSTRKLSSVPDSTMTRRPWASNDMSTG
jgi:hypothetical protein